MYSYLKYKILTWYFIFHSRYNSFLEKRKYLKFKNRINSKIRLIKDSTIASNEKQILLFAIMRNESIRLPYFIEYYQKLGVDRFYLMDNNSTDNTIKILSENNDVNILKTKDSYINHWYWMEYMLETFGRNHWCIVVDIDELFSYPNVEKISIPQLCRFLEKSNSNAVRALLLDMYSDKSVKDIDYIPGQNPLSSISFFDNTHYEVSFPYFDRYKWETFNSTHYTGGMRERVFGKSIPATSLNKFPLFKFTKDVYLGQGMHAINGARVSDLQGIVFHTKFLGDAIIEAEEESIREQHFNNAAYYKDFKREFDRNPDLCLANAQSIRYESLDQLVDLGLMKTSHLFEDFVKTISTDHQTNLP